MEFPHHYRVSATMGEGDVTLASTNLPDLASAPPAEFGGPGNRWSPEHLLVAAVADCFALTFRAVAAASKLDWTHLEVDVEGTLDRVERVMQFSAFAVRPRLTVPHTVETSKAEKVLAKAEKACLITSSLKSEVILEASVVVA